MPRTSIAQPAVVANTDRAWFDHFRPVDELRRVDEVNFWRPAAQEPSAPLPVGGPFFLRLKAPVSAIVGFGSFAVVARMSVGMAWEVFGERNGDPTVDRFVRRIHQFRAYLRPGKDPGRIEDQPITCQLLREAVFLPTREWVSWQAAEGWSPRIVTYKTYDLTTGPGRLLADLLARHPVQVPDLAPTFTPLTEDTRTTIATTAIHRASQGTFRVRVLTAYGGRCAVTGERALPTLDAAHIQPYLGPASNHVQNGLMLRADLHRLYDAGYVTVTPDYRLAVSARLRSEFANGELYFLMEGTQIVVPDHPEHQPSRAALAWHVERVFR